MRIEYFAETDTLYVGFVDRPSVESRDVDGAVLDYDEAGTIVGLEIDGASGRLDLSSLETIALPLSEQS